MTRVTLQTKTPLQTICRQDERGSPILQGLPRLFIKL